MKVKFGFLVSTVQTVVGGTYDPVASFREQPITKWLVKVGDTVDADTPIVQFATDKVDVEVPFSGLCTTAKSGVIISQNYRAGDTWKRGPAGKNIENLPGGDKMFLPELGWIETEEILLEKNPAENPAENHTEIRIEKVRAAPRTRKLALEAGVDISEVKGTGIGGRITLGDVKRKIGERKEPTEPAPQAPVMPEGVILLTPSREKLTIRDNLVGGDDYPLAGGELAPCDLSELLRLKERYRKEYERVFQAPLHLSVPVMIALSRILREKRFWRFNGYWHVADKNDRQKDKVALYTSVNMGISIDLGKEPEIDLEKRTMGGVDLRIATLHDAHALNVREFIKQHNDLMSRAVSDINEHNGKLVNMTLRDWTGWTFIFNNIGAAGHIRGLSLPTRRIAAMLNMGVIGKDGMTIFQIFFDHRMASGVPATQLMNALYEELMKRVIPEIELMLIGS